MAWLAVDNNGTEKISDGKPLRGWGSQWEYEEEVWVESEQGFISVIIEIPVGSIEKLIGRKITWKDEPVGI